MAIWQFDFMIIPKGKKNQNGNFDETISWHGYHIDLNRILILSENLPVLKSWNNDIIQLGEIDQTCLEILKSGDEIQEIQCRLDLRTITEETLIKIIDVIKCINADIFYENHIYEVSLKNLMRLIDNSDTARFCYNPKEFFSNIKKR